MNVSVIICFYERLGHLTSCLNSLKLQSDYFSEVLIVDDGSCDSTVHKLKEAIRRYDFPITHLWTEKNGFRLSAIRNNGIRHSKGDYLIFLDCDFSLLQGAIKAHVNAAAPKRFVGGYCKYLDESHTNEIIKNDSNGLGTKLLEEFYNMYPEKPVHREHRNFMKYSILRRFHLVGPRKQKCLGGHFSLFKQDVELVNGFDENFVGWGGEDEDFFLRLNKAGLYGKSVIKEARAMHLWHPHALGGKHWKEGSNVEYLYRKNIPFFCENGLLKK